MKHAFTLALSLLLCLAYGQIPEKEDLFRGYYVGHKAFEAAQTLNHRLIDSYYKDTTNLSFLLEGIRSKRFHEDSVSIRKVILYNQMTQHYEFLVFSGQMLPRKEGVLLYDYYFVLQIEIDLTKPTRATQILNTTIITGEDSPQLKAWWRAYMRSYQDPKYAKKEIADKYGLVPPPPPPPETADWF